LKKDFRN